MSPAIRTVAPALLSCGLAACAGPRVASYPARAPDLYPLSQTTQGVSVAVDEMHTGLRAYRYFGADLPGRAILPVTVLISNQGPHSVILQPGDVLLSQGREVVDPMPPGAVAPLAPGVREPRPDGAPPIGVRGGGGLASYFEQQALKETVLAPGQSYHGVMFFALPPQVPVPEADLPIFLTDSTLQVVVAARDLKTHQRLRFGPFPLPPVQDGGR